MLEMKTLPFEENEESRNINKDGIADKKSLNTVMQLPPMHHHNLPGSLDTTDNLKLSE